jgi:hypothetical protein
MARSTGLGIGIWPGWEMWSYLRMRTLHPGLLRPEPLHPEPLHPGPLRPVRWWPADCRYCDKTWPAGGLPANSVVVG